MRSFWFSTERMTVEVVVDTKGVVVEAAPVVRTFVGQRVRNLADWLRKQPGFDWKEMYEADVVRLIVAGSRSIDDYGLVDDVLGRMPFPVPQVVVSGTAKGPDQLGERWAKAHGIPVKLMPADWKANGKGAGFLRNQEMARVATHLVAFWDGHSAGTRHMIGIARHYGLQVLVVRAIRSPNGHWEQEPAELPTSRSEPVPINEKEV